MQTPLIDSKARKAIEPWFDWMGRWQTYARNCNGGIDEGVWHITPMRRLVSADATPPRPASALRAADAWGAKLCIIQGLHCLALAPIWDVAPSTRQASAQSSKIRQLVATMGEMNRSAAID
jgi:hypothetical protein